MQRYTAVTDDGAILTLHKESPEQFAALLANMRADGENIVCLEPFSDAETARFNAIPLGRIGHNDDDGPHDPPTSPAFGTVFTVVCQGGRSTLIKAVTESDRQRELDRTAQQFAVPVIHVQPIGRDMLARIGKDRLKRSRMVAA